MRNYTIEFWRFCFAMLICSTHFLNRCDNFDGSFAGGGYLVVEFFFVMSGFFMMKKYYSVSRAHGYENGSLPAEKAAEEQQATSDLRTRSM